MTQSCVKSNRKKASWFCWGVGAGMMRQLGGVENHPKKK